MAQAGKAHKYWTAGQFPKAGFSGAAAHLATATHHAAKNANRCPWKAHGYWLTEHLKNAPAISFKLAKQPEPA